METAQAVRVQFSSQLSSVACHPCENSFCATSMNGDIEFYTWRRSPRDGGFIELQDGWNITLEEEDDDAQQMIRAVMFMPDGSHIVCGTSSGDIHLIDSASGELVVTSSHEDGVYCLHPVDNQVLAAGQEDGTVSLWDVRAKNVSMRLQYNEQSEYISDLCFNSRANSVVATSGDGTLSIFDVRRGKVKARSDDTSDDEFLSCAMVKRNTKILVGSQEGVLNLFSWGHFEDCSDRYPCHSDSVDCVASFTDDIVITGCGDGIVRVVSILPNRVVCELGALGEDEHVHCLAASADNSLLAACGDSEYLHLWDTSSLESVCQGIQDEAAEIQEDEEDDSGDDSDIEEQRKSKKKRQKTAVSKRKNIKQKTSANNAFFSDL